MLCYQRWRGQMQSYKNPMTQCIYFLFHKLPERISKGLSGAKSEDMTVPGPRVQSPAHLSLNYGFVECLLCLGSWSHHVSNPALGWPNAVIVFVQLQYRA